MRQNKLKNIGQAIFISAAVPIAVFLLFYLLCVVTGNNPATLTTWSNLQVIIRTTIFNGFIAWAFSFNMLNGRFDFSIGSVMVLSTIIGADLAVKLGFGPFGMLVLFIIVGLVLGCISGLAYVILKVPSMVCSIGVTMVYEAMTMVYTEGKGIILIGGDYNNLLVFAKDWPLYGICIGGLIVVMFLSRCTIFGYNFNALGPGQGVCVSVGIPEKKHAVMCYTLSGGLMALAGIINFSVLGTCQPKVGLDSSQYMMSAFLPMFVGLAIGRFSDRNIGILIGALIQAIITSGFTALGFSSTLQQVLNAAIVLGFLFFDGNGYKLAMKAVFEEKRKKALADLEA